MSKLRSPSGNLGAQRDAEGHKFFKREIKGAGKEIGSPFSPMNKVRLAQTDAQIGTLPKGDNTTGGVVGGLTGETGRVTGMKARKT